MTLFSTNDQRLVDKALSSISTHIEKGKKIAVGLSGGVDSAVSIALLKELGHEVIGLFMKNWEEKNPEDGVCPSEQDFQDVALTAKQLNVPYFPINFTKEYREEVFESFIKGLQEGKTPNPDVLCNLEIKFKHLLNRALHIGAQALATGHYAQCSYQKESNQFFLKRALDQTKDQTYFLYTASQKTLISSIFPLGNLQKKEVRELARIFELPVANKKDSTGICFIGKRDFRTFISQYIGYSPGAMVTVDGKKVGTHQGLGFYTIGQRKGLMIGGEGDPWFVAGKKIDSNELIVVQGEHPSLYSNSLIINKVYWVSGTIPSFPLKCTAKIRYRQPDQECLVDIIPSEKSEKRYKVTFDIPQRAVTPEQSCVLYSGEYCLGGGIISSL